MEATATIVLISYCIMASLRYVTRITANVRLTVTRPVLHHAFRQSTRNASFYNADVAGLTEEEAEVRFDIVI